MCRSAKLVVMCIMLMLVASCRDEYPTSPTPADTQQEAVKTSESTNSVTEETADNRTPFQQSLAERFAQRAADGLSVPSVSYEYSINSSKPMSTLQQQGASPGDAFTIVATTVVHFDGPEQAGHPKWPDFVIEGDVAPGTRGSIREGDYTQQIKAKVEEQVPDAWQSVQFGHEPRTYTFNEEITVTYPQQPQAPPRAGGEDQVASTQSNEFVAGFTILGPDIHNSISACLTILGVDVGCFEAGYDFDYGLGLRLPMKMGVSCPEPLLEGSTYFPTSQVLGLDWSAEDYTQAGVPAEEGNEWVARVNFGAYIRIRLNVVVGWITVFEEGIGPVDEDASSSFATPFGPGAFFSLPSLDVPVWDVSLVAVSLDLFMRITPNLGSEKVTADWTATGDGPGKASGSGANITYTNPTVPVGVGPVHALDGPGYANITLSDCRYYFDRFTLNFGVCFSLNVFGSGVGTWCLPLPGLDLSFITQNLYVGTHGGTPDEMQAAFFIANVPPTAQIDRSGTTLVNGVPTRIMSAGDVLLFTGTAADPGLDDITMNWDWNDGAPAPDVSTTHPVPFAVSETQAHTFADMCLYQVALTAVDDDLDFGQDVIPVVVTGSSIDVVARHEGYWQHQLRGNGHVDYAPEEIGCMLGIVEHMSSVFGEMTDVSTAEAAFNCVFLQNNHGSELQQLERELLVAWLNFACGAYGYMEVLDTDGDGVGDTPFAMVVATAESVCADPTATPKELKRQTQILHHIQPAPVPVPAPTGRTTMN